MLILKGSGVGVNIAPRITLAKSAYLHWLINNFELTNPTFAKARIIMGSKKAQPHIAIIISVNEIKLSMLMLVEITSFPNPNKKLSIDGATNKYAKIEPNKKSKGVPVSIGIVIFFSFKFNPGKIKLLNCQIITGDENVRPKKSAMRSVVKKNSPGFICRNTVSVGAMSINSFINSLLSENPIQDAMQKNTSEIITLPRSSSRCFDSGIEGLVSSSSVS